MRSLTYPPNVVYVGLQKTGSTFLRGYFSNHPEVNWTRHGAFFQTEVADLDRQPNGFVRSHYEAFFTEDTGKPCRIDMYESIGMGYLLKGIDAWSAEYFIQTVSPFNKEHIFTAPLCVAERIKAAIPDGKILLTIRNQASWLDSNYRHFFEQLPHGQKFLFDFMSSPEGRIVLDAGMFDRIVEIYDRLFGQDRVFVLPMERLEETEELALRDLCMFLGIAHLPYRQADKVFNRGRPLDKLEPTHLKTPSKNFSLLRRLLGTHKSHFKLSSEEVLKHIAQVYAASNARLSRRIGFDLAKLGYPV
jgi:hypothetical protein